MSLHNWPVKYFLLGLILSCGGASSNNIDAGVDGNVEASLSVSPTSFTFDAITFGEVTQEETFTITNTKASATTVSVSSAGDSAAFNLNTSACNNVTLQPQETCQFSSSFQPANVSDGIGNRTLQVSVRDNVTADVVVVPMQGEVLNPKLTVTTLGGGSVIRSHQSNDSCGPNCFRHPIGNISLTPVPDAGMGIDVWTSTPSVCGGRGNCTFNLTGNTVIEAQYLQEVTLNVQVTGTGQVTGLNHPIDCGPGTTNVCSAKFIIGDLIGVASSVAADFTLNGINVICENAVFCDFPVNGAVAGEDNLIVSF